jgi:hypothetical protein
MNDDVLNEEKGWERNVGERREGDKTVTGNGEEAINVFPPSCLTDYTLCVLMHMGRLQNVC